MLLRLPEEATLFRRRASWPAQDRASPVSEPPNMGRPLAPDTISRTTLSVVASLLLSGSLGHYAAAAQASEDRAARSRSAVPSAADVQILKELLTAAASVPLSTDPASETARRRRMDGLARKISDPDLRSRVRSLRGELEEAAARNARIEQVRADVKGVGGTTKMEPGGPQWLRGLVGDEPMEVFSRLIEVDLFDGQNPHDPNYRRSDRISDDWLARLADCTDLRVLNLANTSVAGPGLRYVEGLKKLESLNLTLMPLADPHLVHLRGLTRLRVLYLASTQVTGEGCRYLSALTHLGNLNCHFTPVNDAGLAQIGRLTSLERLEIVHTHFTDAGAAHLRSLTHLRRLQLGSRDATGAALANLRALPELAELDVHDLQPCPRGDLYLGDLKGLRVLRIYTGSFQGGEIRQLAGLSGLEELNLSGVRVSDADVAPLTGLTRLRTLVIPAKQVSETALRSLQAALPGLQVTH